MYVVPTLKLSVYKFHWNELNFFCNEIIYYHKICHKNCDNLITHENLYFAKPTQSTTQNLFETDHNNSKKGFKSMLIKVNSPMTNQSNLKAPTSQGHF